ncbi:angiopoietin-1-like [Anopheles ziemanni]|uniref:angiopoietin-1-like n=1 Tax=Anopheles coustani TaxID=139045 RepID=UPI002657E247|nr:angiopoietin-1-like [Anopheles coustani]XP_058167530.1 angiopoietin-1-like [Anopheles ziemanni]
MRTFFLVLTLALALASAASTSDTKETDVKIPEEVAEEIAASDDVKSSDDVRDYHYYNVVHGSQSESGRPANYAPAKIGYGGGGYEGEYEGGEGYEGGYEGGNAGGYGGSSGGYGGGSSGGYGGGYGGGASYPTRPPKPDTGFDFPKPKPPPKCNCKDIIDQIDELDEKIVKSLLDLEIKADSIQGDVAIIHKETEKVAFTTSQTQLIANAVDNQLNIVRQNLTIIESDVDELTQFQQNVPDRTYLIEALFGLKCSYERKTKRGDDRIYSSCDDPSIKKTGSYWIKANFFKPVKAVCLLDYGGRWMVIQNRFDGSVDFYRPWREYKYGFGNNEGGEYWLGLDRIHQITSSGSYELLIVLEDFEKNITYGKYEQFAIGGENEQYKIQKLKSFVGSAGDSFMAEGMRFSTYDFDNDRFDQNCAAVTHGAWWYKSCGDSNLNGLYLNGPTLEKTGIFWYTFRGYNYSLKKTRMMIRRREGSGY